MGVRPSAADDVHPRSEKAIAGVRYADIGSASQSRLMSLDFFRGFTMFLLIGEGTRI
jgi:hypothetical protein